MRRSRPILVVASVLLAASLAGGCSDREKQEAKVVVQRVDALELRGDIEKRRKKVNELDKLELETKAAKQARDGCVKGHRALLDVEENQQIAKDEFGTLEGARAMKKANEALGEADELLHRCNDDVSGLKAKLRDRR